METIEVFDCFGRSKFVEKDKIPEGYSITPVEVVDRKEIPVEIEKSRSRSHSNHKRKRSPPRNFPRKESYTNSNSFSGPREFGGSSNSGGSSGYNSNSGGRGRGRERVIPAWMSKQEDTSFNLSLKKDGGGGGGYDRPRDSREEKPRIDYSGMALSDVGKVDRHSRSGEGDYQRSRVDDRPRVDYRSREEERPRVDYRSRDDRPRIDYRSRDDRPRIDRGDDRPRIDRGDDRPRIDRGDDRPRIDRGDDRPRIDRGREDERPRVDYRSREERPRVDYRSREERPRVDYNSSYQNQNNEERKPFSEPERLPEDLPVPWKAVTDKNTGKTYYWNTETNTTSWTKPN